MMSEVCNFTYKAQSTYLDRSVLGQCTTHRHTTKAALRSPCNKSCVATQQKPHNSPQHSRSCTMNRHHNSYTTNHHNSSYTTGQNTAARQIAVQKMHNRPPCNKGYVAAQQITRKRERKKKAQRSATQQKKHDILPQGSTTDQHEKQQLHSRLPHNNRCTTRPLCNKTAQLLHDRSCTKYHHATKAAQQTTAQQQPHDSLPCTTAQQATTLWLHNMPPCNKGSTTDHRTTTATRQPALYNCTTGHRTVAAQQTAI